MPVSTPIFLTVGPPEGVSVFGGQGVGLQRSGCRSTATYTVFSKRHEKQWDYLTTQYIAEKVKNKGFDGISFFSSVYSGDNRTNYTIFNLEKCEAINSKLCKVANITVEFSFDAPHKVEVDREYLESEEAAEEFERELFREP